LLDAVEEWSWSSHPEGAGIGQFAWGGAINRVPATETAFPHRAAMYLFSMTAAWNEHDPPDVEAACVAWLARRREQMREYAPDAAYANFADPELADWRDAYYGPNRARLEEIKHYYDPDRTFDFPQAI
jgi:hypothetical protein